MAGFNHFPPLGFHRASSAEPNNNSSHPAPNIRFSRTASFGNRQAISLTSGEHEHLVRVNHLSALSRHTDQVLRWLWANWSVRGERMPVEIQVQIYDYVQYNIWMDLVSMTDIPKPPSRRAFNPPSSGACPFMKLPTELRKSIFALALEDTMKTKTYFSEPQCENDQQVNPSPVDLRRVGLPGMQYPPVRLRNNRGSQSSGSPNSVSSAVQKIVDRFVEPRPNHVANLMRLNKRICQEVSLMMYEENFCTIHVHEGLLHGGIEFLNIGRQKLQYMSGTSDRRFVKFSKDEEFGFSRLKKINITIFPAAEGDNFRHNSMFTYYTNIAICRLLQEGRYGDGSINHIRINFGVDTNQTPQSNQSYWWDWIKQVPRTTSFEGLRNIEMALRPFATLSNCHNVDIQLPVSVKDHKETVEFVKRLSKSITSRDGISAIFTSDELELKMDMARQELEDEILHVMHGGSGPRVTVKNLGEDDLYHSDFDGADDEDEDGEDDDEPMLFSDSPSPRPGSPSPATFEPARKLRETGTQEEERELEEALLASLDGAEPMDAM